MSKDGKDGKAVMRSSQKAQGSYKLIFFAEGNGSYCSCNIIIIIITIFSGGNHTHQR